MYIIVNIKTGKPSFWTGECGEAAWVGDRKRAATFPIDTASQVARALLSVGVDGVLIAPQQTH